MARRSTDPESTADDTADLMPTTPPTSEPRPSPAKHDDVLVYVRGGGPRTAIWNDRPREDAPGPKIPQQHRVRLEPGLSFCPGAHWDHVRQTPTVQDGIAIGEVRPVAGMSGALAQDLARVKPAALAEMLKNSFHVEALLRLQTMEQDGEARDKVLAALEDRLDALKVQLRKFTDQRSRKRRHNRGLRG